MKSFEGIILINKPKDFTSHDVVAKVRRILNTSRVGHAGTLDPLATGLLVILVGRATRLSNYLLSGLKTYKVKVKLGVETDTLDADGVVLKTHEGIFPEAELVASEARALVGSFEWNVPDYSAAKVNGKELYKYAREGREVPVVKKIMTFKDVKVLETTSSEFTAELTCEKGGFIRTWASELGKKLGTGGIVQELTRIESHPYNLSEALTLEDLTDLTQKEESQVSSPALISLPSSMGHVHQISLNKFEAGLMQSGQIPESVHIQWNRGERPRLIALRNTFGELVAVLEGIPAGGDSAQEPRLKVGCVL